MVKNTGVSYEHFTKEVYETILKREGFKDIIVKHNITEQGISGINHQIDVYFEYKIADAMVGVALECKDYATNIPQEKLMAFKSKVDDISKVSKAIFVTKTGFQKGAIQYAKSQGIELIELREVEDYDWEGLVKIISGEIIACSPKNLKIIGMKLNEEYAIKNNIKEITLIFKGNEDEFVFYDNGLKAKFTFYDLKNKLPLLEKESDEIEHKFEFEEPIFIKNENTYIQIDSITLKADIIRERRKFEVDASDGVLAMKKSVLSDEKKFIRK